MTPKPLCRRRLVSVAGALVLSGAASPVTAAKPAATLIPPPLLGAKTAPKRFVIWGSYTCPYTAMLVPVLRKLQADLPSRVAVEWRHFPLHPPDPALHVAAMAVPAGLTWDFTSLVLAYYVETSAPPDGPKLLELLKRCGADRAGLERALAAPRSWATLKRDMLAGQLLGVTATPALFVDGYFLTPDGLPNDLASFDAALRAMKGVADSRR
jgi:protein-disulfide isomerase